MSTPLTEDQLLPFERPKGEGSPDTVEDALFDALGSDPAFDGREEEPDSGSSEAVASDEEEVFDDAVPEEEPEGAAEEAEEADEDEVGSTEESDDEEEFIELDPESVVEVDGERTTLRELQDRGLRQADYTRKTQEVAEERKQLRIERAQTQEARAQYLRRLDAAESLLEEMMPAEPDWAELRRTNPAEFAAQREEWRERKAELERVRSEKSAVQEEMTEEQQAALRDLVAQEQRRLVEEIPEWRDPEKAQAGKRKLAEYASQHGYTPQQLSQIYDHRVLVLLRKAMLYDKLRSDGKETVETTSRKTKVLPPGGRDTTPKKRRVQRKRLKASRERLAQTGRADDAARVIYELLPEE